MAVKDLSKAVGYTDRHLRKIGKDRQWVQAFWLDETEEGQAVRDSVTYGSSHEHAENDHFFIHQMVVDVQQFVFSDVGDAAMGVPQQPATDAEMDGLLGSMTSRRMQTWLDFQADEPELPLPDGSEYIIFAGERLPIEGVKVFSFDEDGGLDLVKHNITRNKGKLKGFSKWRDDVDKLIASSTKYANMLSFGHWDVCGSSAKCFKALAYRNLGSSAGIDNDGTVWWWSDPGLMYGWHGGTNANRQAVFSYDLSNAVSLKYAANYEKKVGIARPVLYIDKYERLGRGNGFLGMYEAQLVALLRVLKVLSARTGLPFTWPVKADGLPIGRNWDKLWKSGYQGCATHRHLPTTTKWDVRGLEYQIMVLLMTRPTLMAEFPEMVECFKLHDAPAQSLYDKFKETCRWPELGIG